MAQLMPMLDYADAPAAIDFLRDAFGFEETFRMDGEDGTVAHCELALDGAVIALSIGVAGRGLLHPARVGGRPQPGLV